MEITTEYLLPRNQILFAANFAIFGEKNKVSLEMYDIFVNAQKISALPQKTYERDLQNRTLLHYAVAGGIKAVFCPYPELLKERDEFGITALMIAAYQHSVELVEYLVIEEAGLQDNYGKSSLMYACVNIDSPDAMKIIDFLIDYEWFITDNEGKCFLDLLDPCTDFYEQCEERVLDIANQLEQIPENLYLQKLITDINGNKAEIESLCSIFSLIESEKSMAAEWEKMLSNGDSKEEQQIVQTQQRIEELKSQIREKEQQNMKLEHGMPEKSALLKQNTELKRQLQEQENNQ